MSINISKHFGFYNVFLCQIFFFFFFPHKDGKNMVSFKLQNGSDHLEHFKSKLQHSEVEM